MKTKVTYSDVKKALEMGFVSPLNSKAKTAIEHLKLVCKKLGVCGFRKLALKRSVYVIGKQCIRLSRSVVSDILKSAELLGLKVSQADLMASLNHKGMVDTISVEVV